MKRRSLACLGLLMVMLAGCEPPFAGCEPPMDLTDDHANVPDGGNDAGNSDPCEARNGECVPAPALLAWPDPKTYLVLVSPAGQIADACPDYAPLDEMPTLHADLAW